MRLGMAWGVSAVVVSALAVGTSRAADAPKVQSGLDVGEFASPFDVKDITGPNKGQTLCYR